ncbi:MAG: N-methyl-L-tryptophan oxidase [Gemmatimonadales bacterium]|nr:N-methyl-L-tryptophan oxidase [Gemmatimonadales bacterium]
MTYDVIVAGLGAIGSAAAWQMAGRGLKVLGLDRYRPPHALGSSHGGSRVIRELAFEHPRYVPMARRGYELWDELAAESGRGDLLIPTGALYLGAPESSIVAGSRASAAAHDVPCEELSAAEVCRRWPAFRPDGMVGLFENRAGVLWPEACVETMLTAAASRPGVELCFDEPMIAWGEEADGAVWVLTTRQTYRAERLVLATGPWMAEVLSDIGVTVTVERVVQHWFAPARDEHLLGPARFPVYLCEDSAGVICYGFPLLDGAMKAAVHHRGESTTADTVRREVGSEEVAQTRDRLARYIPAAAGEHLRSEVCMYTNPTDGGFIIDQHPEHRNVLLASACSGIGFKFAPAVGEILADLATGASPRFDLAPFRAQRL